MVVYKAFSVAVHMQGIGCPMPRNSRVQPLLSKHSNALYCIAYY